MSTINKDDIEIMALTSADKNFETFSGLNLNKTHVETIIRRSLTDHEWRSYNRDYKSLFSLVAKQASNIAAKKFKTKKVKLSHQTKKLNY